MPTFALTIEYDGTPFSGWQAQPNDIVTVQGVLEDALKTVLRTPVRIQGAARTDAGVHALGQRASFIADTDLEPRRIAKSLSALAKPDVAVVDARIVPDEFNARFDSNGKHYRYRILARNAPSPLHRRTVCFVPGGLDIDRMKTAASRLVGEHDFAGFRAADCERESTVRYLSIVEVVNEEGGYISIEVKGTAFLKNMVRIIAGTLIDIGAGRLSPDAVDETLATLDRTKAGQTAAAKGLTLVEVFYPEGWIRER